MQSKQQNPGPIPDEVMEQIVAGTHPMAYDRRETEPNEGDRREAPGKPNQTRINPLYSEVVRP